MTGWVNIYKWDKEWDDYGYDKDSYGIRFGVSYPILYRTRLSLSYLLDNSDIKITDEDEASSNIKKLRGENITSSVTANLRYDSRDRAFNTTRGSTSKWRLNMRGLAGISILPNIRRKRPGIGRYSGSSSE